MFTVYSRTANNDNSHRIDHKSALHLIRNHISWFPWFLCHTSVYLPEILDDSEAYYLPGCGTIHLRAHYFWTGHRQCTASRPQKQLQQIKGLQKTAAIFVTLFRKFIHITPNLKQIHWLSIKQRIVFKMFMFVFKTIHGVSLTYLCNLVKLYDILRENMHPANKLLLTNHKYIHLWEHGRSLYPQQKPGMHNQFIL